MPDRLSLAGVERRQHARVEAARRAGVGEVRLAADPWTTGLNVSTDIRPAALDGDPVLIQQLAANLIDNAIRHNIPGGDIQVSTFQPFQRLGPRPARRDGGHGLGLSIVRAIASAHAATIAARPQPGGGLAIDVTFPPPLAPQPQPRGPRTGRPARV